MSKTESYWNQKCKSLNDAVNQFILFRLILLFLFFLSKKEVEVLDLCDDSSDEESGDGKPSALPEINSKEWTRQLTEYFRPSFAMAKRVPGVGKSSKIFCLIHPTSLSNKGVLPLSPLEGGSCLYRYSSE